MQVRVSGCVDGAPDGFKGGPLGWRPMFERVLVANRGEIAARILSTLRELGVEGVAVHAEDDRDQPHVRLADHALSLGDGPPGATYLDVDKIVQAAVESGCDAVHPGYGFLSEQPELPEALAKMGIAWVGPPPSALRALGDKARALELARKLGVPTTPGSEGPVGSLEEVQSAVVQIVAEGSFIDPEFGLQLNSAGSGTGL